MGSPSKQPAARLGDIDTGHPPAPPTPIITASPNVFINGIPAARKGDMLAPHHPGVRIITEGSNSVKINGMPAARITDAINCGGTIVVGSGNVMIGDTPPSGSPLAPGEWQDFIDSSMTAGPQSPYQSQQMRADTAVKYRGSAAGSGSWNDYYSGISPKQRPAPASVQNPVERTGLVQANNTPPAPAPTLPAPAQQQVIDSAGQQMTKAIANLAEAAMVTPEMLGLASTMVQAGAQSNKSNQSTGPSVSNKKSVKATGPSTNLSGKEAIAAKRVYLQSLNSKETLVIGKLDDTAAGAEIGMGRLNDPDWTINVNDAWVQGGIDAGKPFYMGSNISIKNLRSGNPVYPKTIFFRELSQLRDAGYYRQGDWMLPPKQ